MKEQEELLTMLTARAKLGGEWKESIAATKQMADGMVTKYQRNVDVILRENPEFLRQNIADWRQKEMEQTGRGISRPQLAFKWIQFVCETQIRESGLMAIAKGNIPQFLMMFDISDGVGRAMGGILMGESWLRRNSIDLIDNAIRDSDEFFGNPIDTNQRQRHLDAFEKEAQDCANSLRIDPSGYSLISNRVDILKTGGKKGTSLEFPPYQIPEFLVAGAKIAELVYKKIYPFTE